MPSTQDYLNYVLEQLAGLGDVTSRRMFGGWGLYSDEVFFGIISDDTLYFKVDDSNRKDYESRGMSPFRPYADRPQVSLTYFEVPADALEDGKELAAWARRSIAVAVATSAKKSTRRASGKAKKSLKPKAKKRRSP